MFVFWETQEPWENPERKKERGMNCLLIPTDSSSIWEPNPAVRLHFENPSHYIGWVWFSFLKKCIMKKWSFQKVHNEKVLFQKAECLVKAVKKCFLKKLSVWLVLIKVAIWGINYQKGQCIYKSISSKLDKFLCCLDNQQWHLSFAYPLF